MPIAIKGLMLKYKNTAGKYVGVNVISERSTAEQVAEITTLGNHYVHEIEEAGGTIFEAVTRADAASAAIEHMSVGATGTTYDSDPEVHISEISGHKHIAFAIPAGAPGKDFHIAKTFTSIAEMMAYTGSEVGLNEFVVIDTGSVEDPDTGKLYRRDVNSWSYIGDLSGAQGIQGPVGPRGNTGNGISGISKTGTNVLVDTYTIYFTDGNATTFDVINGNGIVRIEKSTNDLVDTYTLVFGDGTSYQIELTNGRSIDSIEKTYETGLDDVYTIAYNDGSTSTFVVKNGNGIVDIHKSTSGLTDKYTLDFGDGSTFDIDLVNGRGITGIAKTGTEGVVDTYTISYNDGTSNTFTVTNGENAYTWIKYSEHEPTSDSDMHDTIDNWIGVCSNNRPEAPEHYNAYQWFEIKGPKGDKGDDVTVRTTKTEYQTSDNGTVVPTTWYDYIPSVRPGSFLWTKVTVYFNPSGESVFYTAIRSGMDGTGGTVRSVNGVLANADGEVTLVRVSDKVLIIG